MNALAAMWKQLPRSAQWLGYLMVFVAAYLALVAPALRVIDGLHSESDKIENALRRERDLASPDSDEGRMLAQSRRAFGEPHLPSDPSAKAETLYRVVNRILKDNKVDDAAIGERRGTDLKADQVAGFVSDSAGIERFTLEVSFEADPLTVAAVLAALEQAPEVTAVGRVKIDKPNSGGFGSWNGNSSSKKDEQELLRVTIAPEAWILASRSGERGGTP